jgi:hypothetical protein
MGRQYKCEDIVTMTLFLFVFTYLWNIVLKILRYMAWSTSVPKLVAQIRSILAGAIHQYPVMRTGGQLSSVALSVAQPVP